MKKICFHARGNEKNLDHFDYYSNDIKTFESLGYEVHKSWKTSTIPFDCDIYYIWWWSSGIIPLIVAKLLGKPAIMIGNIHLQDASIQGYYQRNFYTRFLIRLCLKYSDIQLTTSEIELEGIKKLGATKPMMIYHAIDSERYTFNSLENRSNYLLTLTRFTQLNLERKKIYQILNAFKLVKDRLPADTKLIIAGSKEDDGFPKLQEYVSAIGLANHVEFPGYISDDDKIQLYQNCQIYIQPTDFEGFGMAIAESMCCGTPVITSPSGAVPEVTADLAYFVDPNDVNDISNGILRLVSDKKLKEKLSVEGSQRIRENFSIAKRKQAIKSLLDQL